MKTDRMYSYNPRTLTRHNNCYYWRRGKLLYPCHFTYLLTTTTTTTDTLCLKNHTYLACLITTTNINQFWQIFSRNITVSKQSTMILWFIAPPRLTNASALPGKTCKQKNMEIASFHSQCCITSCCLTYSILMTCNSYTAAWLSESCNQLSSPLGCLGPQLRRNEVENSLLLLLLNCVAERQNCHVQCVW